MDWCEVNKFPHEADGIVTTLSDRIQKTENHYTVNFGVAHEWQIDLCNRVNADYWVNIPHKTYDDYIAHPTDNYWTKLATLVKNTLKPELSVYVELSDETWNQAEYYLFQYNYCNQKGASLGLTGAAFHTYEMVRIAKAFKDVFGDQYATHVKPVLAGFIMDVNWSRLLVNAVSNTTVNPYGIKFDNLSVAPYACASSLTNNVNMLAQHANIAKAAGMKLTAYEYGCTEGRTDPATYNFYTTMLDRFNPYLDLCIHYTHTGSWNGWGWGLLDHTGQPMSESPAYRAVVDWGKAHTAVAPAPSKKAAVRAAAAVQRPTLVLTHRATAGMYGLNGKRAMNNERLQVCVVPAGTTIRDGGR